MPGTESLHSLHRGLFALLLAAGLVSPAFAEPCEVSNFVGADTTSSDHFAISMAHDGEWLVVGAPDDNSPSSDAGSAFVFQLIDGAWVQAAKLVASDAASNDAFGTSVAIDGDTIAVGAPEEDASFGNSGAVYVFHWDGLAWTEQDRLKALAPMAAANLGDSVAIEGDTLVAGAPGDEEIGSDAGAVHVFQRSGTNWTQQAKLFADDTDGADELGTDVAIQGGRILAGAPLTSTGGAAYTFVFDGLEWIQEATLAPLDTGDSDQFGADVDLEGDTAVIGSRLDDSLVSNTGAVYVFQFIAPIWVQAEKLVTVDGEASDNFGSSVRLLGDRMAIGATGVNQGPSSTGAAYHYEKDPSGNWILSDKLTSPNISSNGSFGSSVELLDEHVLVGAPDDNGNGNGFESGSVSDFFYGLAHDCNANLVEDICDVSGGTSPDCNGNFNPDECDVASGGSQDCSGNGVPDECEPDCNLNLVADSCDIVSGTSADCGADGVPDECLAILFFSEDFATQALDPKNWALVDGATADWFGVNEPSQRFSLRMDGNPDGSDEIQSATLDLEMDELITLSYFYQRTGGGDSPETGDDLRVEYRDAEGNWNLLMTHTGAGTDSTVFTFQSVALPGAARHANFAFRFVNTATVGGGDDWFVDDIRIQGSGVPDCNGNGLPDTCDTAMGTSEDCSGNDVPDECEEDCNGNGVADSCDIAAGLSVDCNSNGRPDACDLTQRVDGDCDRDGILNGCDAEACISQGITLLANVKPPEIGASAGNSVWAYVSPSGREYGIMGWDIGTSFFDLSDPANPVEVAFEQGPESTWRDMRVYDHYAYAVSEGGDGIQVFDLSAIDDGVVTFIDNVTEGGTQDTHTMGVNVESGLLYRSGGGAEGIRFYDLADPADPNYVGEWSERYCHETEVITYFDGPYAGREIAFCCGGTNTGYDLTGLYVVDITDKLAPFQISYYAYPLASYAHQAFPSPDLKYLYLNDEFDEDTYTLTTNTHVIDISVLENPLEVGTFTNGSSSIDHNEYTLGRLIFQANYTSGLRIFDATDPVVPVEIGYYDTWPQDDAVIYDGLWNNHPYLPSGVVLGSDISTGFYVWDVSALKDCNGNGIDDGADIATGASRDCNISRIPDECEFDDCNANCIPDYEDVNSGASPDENGDGVPDDCVGGPCQGDVNGDGLVDPLDTGFVLSRLGCDISGGDPLCAAADANNDGIIDPLDVGYVLSRLGQCL